MTVNQLEKAVINAAGKTPTAAAQSVFTVIAYGLGNSCWFL